MKKDCNQKSMPVHAIQFELLMKLLCIYVLLLSRLSAQIPADGITSCDSVCFGNLQIESEKPLTTKNVDLIRKEFFNQITNRENYDRLTEMILSEPLQAGYYFPILFLSEVRPVSDGKIIYLNPVFNLQWCDPVRIDTILFTGNEKTSNRVLIKSTDSFKKKLYTESTAGLIAQSLRRYSFCEVSRVPEIVRTKDGLYGLLIQVVEKQDNRFSGVIGYVPEKAEEKGYFTGEIDLKMLNLSGSGRQVTIFWSKINRYSQELYLKYYEPWIWKTNLFGESEFRQILRDTMVVNRELKLGFGRFLKKTGNIRINFGSQSTIPTPGGQTALGLIPTHTSLLGFELAADRTDRPMNPTRGTKFDVEWMIGKRSIDERKSQTQYQAGVQTEWVFPLRQEWVIDITGQYKGKWVSTDYLTYADQFWFGGARSLRGYPNDFFSGTEIGWMSFEIRWLISKLSRVYLFTDHGFFKTAPLPQIERGYPKSFGIGLRLESRMGVIGLDYGFGKGDTFSTAKIHVYVENQF